MTPRVFLISGKKRAGKDSFAAALAAAMAELHGEPTAAMAFADPIKRCVAECFRLSPDQTTAQELKEVVDPRWGLTPREIMQRFGTEVGRTIHPDVWALNLVDRIKEALAKDPTTNVVVPDCRFPNELELVRGAFPEGFVASVLVTRKDADDGRFAAHASETALDGADVAWDFLVDNCGALEDLKKTARRVAGHCRSAAAA